MRLNTIKSEELIEVYNDYDNNIYLPTVDRSELGYELMPKYEGEPNPVQVMWKDIINVNKISSVFKNGMVRFYDEEVEEIAFKILRINQIKGAEIYTRDKIESMIVNCTDEVLKEIVDIKDLRVINLFYNILVGLQNSNVYDVSNRVELYIRARKEELEKKVLNSELEVIPSKTIETAIIEEVIEEEVIEEEVIEEEVIEEVVEIKEKPKRRATATTKAKTTPKAKATVKGKSTTKTKATTKK